MSDPIIINQIIASLGLTGQEAEAKRQELEKPKQKDRNLKSSQTMSLISCCQMSAPMHLLMSVTLVS